MQAYIEKEDSKKLKQRLKRHLCLNFFGRVKDYVTMLFLDSCNLIVVL
jgi:hypothetical protein